jgi:uncharacterized protein YjeT (DUF2065 family)
VLARKRVLNMVQLPGNVLRTLGAV